MTISYDVSDLMGWQLPHLTGIQRVTVGILQGLAARGVGCRLVRFDHRLRAFVPVDVHALPELIRRHLPQLALAGTAAPAAAVSPREAFPAGPAPLAVAARGGRPQPRNRLRATDRILGTDPAARQLRQAVRAFKGAARDLRRQAKRWALSRFQTPEPPSSRPIPVTTEVRRGVTAPLPVRHHGQDQHFSVGDVLISLGATWGSPDHAEVVGLLRARGVRVLRMIYDLIPTLKPHWVLPAHVAPITAWARRVLTESDHVFTISDFSRQEIERYCLECGFQRPSLSVVRLGDVMAGAAESEHPPLPRFVPRRPFFICVSTLDVRKNHRLLYDAWRRLATDDPAACPDLLCIGTPHLHVADLLREIQGDRLVNGRMHVLHGIDDRELAWYYRHCLATIYPSWYEGWGLPVAESLGQGKMCLASNATSIPEISADLPEFFAPHDSGRLVDLVGRVLRDPGWRAAREAEIRRSFRPTAWTDTAAQVLEALDVGGVAADRAA